MYIFNNRGEKHNMDYFWGEIYKEKLNHNIELIKNKTDKKIMAVVKGDAYGLGTSRISKLLDTNDNVDCFAVSFIREALDVKSDKDILVLTPWYKPTELKKLKRNHILTVDNDITLKQLNALNRKIRVHIYVDLGMNRFGVKQNDVKNFIKSIEQSYPNLLIDGMYGHLNNVSDREYTISQIKDFGRLAKRFKGKIPNIHILNSEGFKNYSEYADYDNMIRIGDMLYNNDELNSEYKKIYSFKSRPICVNRIKKGETIGYGCEVLMKENSRVGIFGIGYINKYFLKIFNNNMFAEIIQDALVKEMYKGTISFKGKPLEILGQPDMSYTLVDIGDIDSNEVFDVNVSAINIDSSIKRYLK